MNSLTKDLVHTKTWEEALVYSGCHTRGYERVVYSEYQLLLTALGSVDTCEKRSLSCLHKGCHVVPKGSLLLQPPKSPSPQHRLLDVWDCSTLTMEGPLHPSQSPADPQGHLGVLPTHSILYRKDCACPVIPTRRLKLQNTK